MIKNLIISGGGYHIFNILGIVYKLQEKNIYNIKKSARNDIASYCR